ncbi:3863_t:CDS:2 [Cetraspora pellucida]|uniref:3863_t:CDS:1 n=1 Tax=Cetraspora pellucida TaxID=1433469 RepID=A0A9N9HIL8_9GLOM|nr:3863_t:CDS:2 [Cetraspora pellucida]
MKARYNGSCEFRLCILIVGFFLALPIYMNHIMSLLRSRLYLTS